MAAAIEISGVTKRFKLYHEKVTSWKERLVHLGRIPFEEFWALKGIDLSVDHGETFGILGHNGSGKSTLLKCTAGILRPTAGTIRTAGRVAALLELGAGFHPDLTGRENVYLNGSILGLSRREVDGLLDDIVAFSGLEHFIDNQVKHYSSGMYARLGFAVAVNVDPDIILIDEVLAVGDESFQRKCIERIRRFQTEGRTILLVTHDADTVRQICRRAAVFDHGELVCVDTAANAVGVFREGLLRSGTDHAAPGEAGADGQAPEAERATLQARLTSIEVVYPDHSREYVRTGETLKIRVHCDSSAGIDDLVCGIRIRDQRGNVIFGTNTQLLGLSLDAARDRVVEFTFGPVPLLDGMYLVTVGAHNSDGGVVYDWKEDALSFRVTSQGASEGLVDLGARVRADIVS